MAKYHTNQRKILTDYLSHHVDKPITAQGIGEELKTLSLSAIYRNLADLEKSGIVQKTVNSDDRKAYYRFVDNCGCKEHIHLSCMNCGKVFHLDNSDTFVEHLFKSEQFEVDKSVTVLYGLCKDCSTL